MSGKQDEFGFARPDVLNNHVCATCGADGDRLHRLAHSYWDIKEQSFVVYDFVHDCDWYCDKCDCEVKTQWEEETNDRA